MKEEKKITDSILRELYATANSDTKRDLNELFGVDFFKEKTIMDNVKTYEDACELIGLIPLKYTELVNAGLSKCDIAFAKLRIITRALNEDWLPDWDDGKQLKWFPLLSIDTTGTLQGIESYGCYRTRISTHAQLCLKSEELAVYSGRKFIELYRDLIGKLKNNKNEYITFNKKTHDEVE